MRPENIWSTSTIWEVEVAEIAQWHVAGDWFDVCSCDIACPCIFGQPPTNNTCRGVLAYRIREGHFGDKGRIARPLNRFEMEPLLYDLSSNFGNKRARNKKIRATEAAWARLQHEDPGYAADPDDQLFERVLIDWLRFHKGMLIGEIIPQVYQYLRDNPAARNCTCTTTSWST